MATNVANKSTGIKVNDFFKNKIYYLLFPGTITNCNIKKSEMIIQEQDCDESSLDCSVVTSNMKILFPNVSLDKLQ